VVEVSRALKPVALLALAVITGLVATATPADAHGLSHVPASCHALRDVTISPAPAGDGSAPSSAPSSAPVGGSTADATVRATLALAVFGVRLHHPRYACTGRPVTLGLDVIASAGTHDAEMTVVVGGQRVLRLAPRHLVPGRVTHVTAVLRLSPQTRRGSVRVLAIVQLRQGPHSPPTQVARHYELSWR
jgi:hypothetical protein